MTGPLRGSRTIAGFALALTALALSACVTVVDQRPTHAPPQPRDELVPAIEGMALHDARAELEDAGYRLGRVTEERDRHAPPGSVLWQDPEPYTRAPLGSRVDVAVATKWQSGGGQPYVPELTTVPELRGLELRQVRRALKRADLRLGDVTEDYARNTPPGTVIWQGPAAQRRVEPGSIVNVVIARANQPVARTTVPKLYGLRLDEARARLRQAQLQLGQVTERPDNRARRGTVIGQHPEPRQDVRPGSVVDVVIVARRQKQPIVTTVPNLHGLRLDEARARLQQAQLQLGQVTERPDHKARRGTVIGQHPEPRQNVRPGSVVDVVVATRRQEQPVARTIVPNLQGLRLDEARARLQQARLRLGQVTEQPANKARRGTVIGQHPKPRQEVRPGSVVDVVIVAHRQEQPIARTTVPKLYGLPLDKARARLKQAQLRLGEVTEQADNNATSGTVIAQTPVPKDQVAPGTAVDLVVAAAVGAQQPSGVEVPDLRGKNAIAAKARLKRLGLRLGQVRTQTKGQGVPGTVLEQWPDPGTVVQPGAAVDLTVFSAASR